jgi:hypothetical protein
MTMSKLTVTHYTISNSNGRRGNAWDEQYDDQEHALHALCEAMGWSEVFESNRYTVSETDSAISCYATQEDCDADETGAYAPRVTAHGVYL